MLHIKNILGAVLVCTVLFLLSGCYKNRTVVIDDTPEVTKTVSFSADILPIFAKDCAVTGCHVSGGKSPDLSADKAYSNLSTGGYLNPSAPDASALYQWMSGKKGTPMPVSGINATNNGLVLAWIKQGALNN